MALYSLAVRTPAANANAAFCDLRTGSSRGYLREVGIFCAASTATTVGLIRPATLGTVSTSQPGQPEDPADATSLLVIGTAWSAVPAVSGTPAYLRRISLPAAIGGGIIWSFAPNELAIAANSSILLWNAGGAAGSALDVYFRWDE